MRSLIWPRFAAAGFLLWLFALGATAERLPEPGPLISEVLAQHPSVRKAEHLVASAQATLEGSRLQPNPTLTLAATAGDASENSNYLTQTFEISGQPRLRYEQAQARLESARLTLRAARRAIAATVYTDWLELWESQQLAVLAQLRLDLMTEMVRVSRRRYEVGEIPQNESLRVELAQAEAEADAQRAMARFRSAQRSLALLRGQPVADIDTSEDGSPLPPVAPEAVEALLAGPTFSPVEAPWTLEQVLSAAEMHPDVEALKQEQKALGLAAELLGKERAPQLGVSLYRSQFFGNNIEQGAQLYISWPVFDWGSISSRKRAQQAQAEAQMASADEKVLELRREVAQGWNNWLAAKSVRGILQTQAQRYQELAREARVAYDLGMMSLTDVLQTETAFRQAGVQLVQAQAEVHRLELGLLRSTNLPWPTELLEER